MLHLACSATRNNRYSERVGKCGKCLVGISCLHSVVVHARKENLPGASLFRFFCPTEQFLFCRDASSVKETRPFAILKTGVNGAHTYLRAKAAGNFVDEFRPSQRCRVYAHFVCSGIKQSFNILDGVDSSAHRERNVYVFCHAGDHLCESLSSLVTCRDVKKHQFVGTCLAVCHT